VLSAANHTTVKGNDLRYNPNAVETADSSNLLIEDNEGSFSQQDGFAIGNGANIVVRGNVANLTGGTGISLEGALFDSLGVPIGTGIVEGNTANENLGAGIGVADGAGHLVRNNRAYHNGEIGISADGNVDGGGNMAAGNGGNPTIDEQCIGVVCTPGDVVPPITALDTTRPDTQLVSGPANPTSETSATFTFSGSDFRDDGSPGTPLTGLAFECRLDITDPPPEPPDPPDPEPPHPNDPPDTPEPFEGEGWMECISPMTYHFLEPGDHKFEVRAVDPGTPDPGDKDLTPAVHQWKVDPLAPEDPNVDDAIAPETRIAEAPPAISDSRSARFRYAGSDNVTLGENLHFECSLDGAAFELCDGGSIDYHSLTGTAPTGTTHTFAVRAIDRKGNADATPATYTWKVAAPPSDQTAPDITLGPERPDPITVRNGWTFTFSSEDPSATFECSLDGAAWTACTSPHALTALTPGTHTFRVRAKDLVPNYSAPATHTWKVGAAPVARNVGCGQVLTQSTRVTNDLTDCVWDGLVVGAPEITIDLNGHTIDGKGIGSGIRNDGYDDVTITGGKVKEFDWGVSLNVGTQRNIVDGLTLEQNQEAAMALGSRGENNPALGLPTPPEPPASFDSEVVGNTLRGNTIIANDQGIWLRHAARENVITDNALGANGHQGVWIERAHDNRVEGNEIRSASGAGVEIEGGERNKVIDNLLEENSGGGISIGVTTGTYSGIPSHDNVAERNVIEESGGAALELAGLEVAPLRGNQFIDNVAHRNNGAAIDIDHARESLVRGNDVRSNKYGIQVNHSRETRLEPVVQQRHPAQHLEPQRRLGHRRQRRGRGRHGLDHRAQPDEQQQGLRHLRAQGEPRDQGQRGERQRHLGHLGQRGEQRTGQRRLGRQHRTGEPRPERPDHAQGAAVLHRALRRHLGPVGPGRAEHTDRRRPGGRDRRRRGPVPLHRHGQREQRRVRVPDRRHLRRGLGRLREPVREDPRGRHAHVRGAGGRHVRQP
jgi:parallel beta-helix repeat protein